MGKPTTSSGHKGWFSAGPIGHLSRLSWHCLSSRAKKTELHWVNQLTFCSSFVDIPKPWYSKETGVFFNKYIGKNFKLPILCHKLKNSFQGYFLLLFKYGQAVACRGNLKGTFKLWLRAEIF